MKTNNKKIFLIWADGSRNMSDMVLELEKNGHEVVYWVGIGKNPLPEKNFIYQDHYDAWLGKPAVGINPEKFAPLSLEFIKKMSETESLVLTMMNKKFDTFSVDERRHVYYEMLRYWNGMIEELKPDFILFPTVPHTVYNFVIYSLAKFYGIKTLMFEDSWVSDRLLKYEDWKEGSKDLKEVMKRNEGKNFYLTDLSEDLKKYYENQTDPKKDSVPVYITHFKKNSAGWNAFKKKIKVVRGTLKDGTFIKRFFGYFGKIGKPNLKKEYEGVELTPDFSKKYVYLTLSFQPERTSSPQGDVFVDQILIAEMLSASLPEEWFIYVKEHPAQWLLRSGISFSSSRYMGYYQRLARLKNVRVMPIGTDTYKLIENCQAVASCAGTAGWEGIIRGKPMLNFGYPWYRDFPGALRINDFESCKQALLKIKNGFRPDSQMVINFLKSFDEATFHGYIEGMVEKISKLSPKESFEKVKEVIFGELNKNI